MTVAIVVPCYNEVHRLRSDAFESFLRTHKDIHFLFVNDGSTDDSSSVLSRLKEFDPDRVALLSFETNVGKAEAVRVGMLTAMAEDPAILGFWDADLATPLEAIDDFLYVMRRRPELEIVMGARVQLLGRRIRRRAARHYLGRVFATVVSIALGIPVYDTQCGAKLFRVGPELRSVLAEPFLSRWVFDVELLARFKAQRRGFAALPLDQAIYELSLNEWDDVRGSKLRLRDFLRAGPEISRIWWRWLRPGASAPLATPVPSSRGP